MTKKNKIEKLKSEGYERVYTANDYIYNEIECLNKYHIIKIPYVHPNSNLYPWVGKFISVIQMRNYSPNDYQLTEYYIREATNSELRNLKLHELQKSTWKNKIVECAKT